MHSRLTWQLWLMTWAGLTAAVSASAGPSPTIQGKDGATMVLVPAGPFTMGSGEVKDETPPRRVDLPAFYIDQAEVTVVQYAQFVKAVAITPPTDWINGAPPDGREAMPITNVSWFDAMRYAMWAGKRLPTEAEWEKAARGTDGRRYPWGNLDNEKLRNLGSDKISSTYHKVVGTAEATQGASPYGCLDMSGNAWEWTADWYDGYPGTSARSIHFGRQYKVMRGGGGIYFYGVANSGTCTQRARLVPYGTHDSLGFRCVVDVDASKRPYEPEQVLKEAEERFRAALGEPARLSYEVEFDQYKQAARVPVQAAGQTGQKGHLRAGFPLPRAFTQDPARIKVLGSDNAHIPAMVTALAHWDDGSIRWALLDFTAEAGARYTIDLTGQAARSKPKHAVVTVEQDGQFTVVDTGAISLVSSPDSLIQQIRRGETAVLGKMALEMQTSVDGKPATLFTLPADKVEVEEARALHATIRMQGFFGTADRRPTTMRYDLRIQAAAGSPRLSLLLTLVHWADRERSKKAGEEYASLSPLMRVADISLRFAMTEKAAATALGTERGVHMAGEQVELHQPDDLHYMIRQSGKPDVRGTRAAGWTAARRGGEWCVLGLRHFWQNCPKSLFVTPEAVGVHLWAGEQPFEWEAGLAKTHEIILDVAARSSEKGGAPVVHLDPLRMVMPPAWACGAEAAGAVLPRCKESLAIFPYWECWRNADMHDWANAMPFGMRDFGDGYMGGPYKGKNAYQDLEYDVPFNYLLEFLRTGELWYLQAAEPMARHQMDVDANNFTGLVWKHSPLHTTTEADLGHVFLRGVLLHHLLTGEYRSLEMARKVGDFIAAKLEAGQGVGNERQIGWSLYLLTGVYEVTRDQKYMHAAETLCHRLMEGQAPTGKFKIRWDNRIAFFNGIAMNGMLTVQENNRDPALAECILKVASRTLGFYPEYACRTLNAFAWALQQTRDPRYLDGLERCWRSSIEFLMDRNTASEATHMWRFPRFAAQYGLFSLFEQPPATLPDPASWKAVRFKDPDVEVFLQAGRQAAPLLVIREGLTQGNVELFDDSGRIVQTVSLTKVSEFFEPTVMSLPADGRIYRLRLGSQKATGWQIHHDRDCRMTIYDPTGMHLPQVYPRSFGLVREGAKEVKIRLEAMVEGFHMATLYSREGQPVATVRHFIDFQDPGRYELELKAPVSGDTTGWSLELCNLKVLSIEGMLPYWATDASELFNPERPAVR